MLCNLDGKCNGFNLIQNTEKFRVTFERVGGKL